MTTSNNNPQTTANNVKKTTRLTVVDSATKKTANDYPNHIVLQYKTVAKSTGLTTYHTVAIPHDGELSTIAIARTMVRYFVASATIKEQNTITLCDENGLPLTKVVERNGNNITVDMVIKDTDILQKYLRATTAEITDGQQTIVLAGDENEKLKSCILGKPAKMLEAVNAAKNKNARRAVINQLATAALNGLQKLTRVRQMAESL